MPSNILKKELNSEKYTRLTKFKYKIRFNCNYAKKLIYKEFSLYLCFFIKKDKTRKIYSFNYT